MGGPFSRIIFLTLLSASAGQADMETTSVLPMNVYSPKFIFGRYSGLNDRYNSVGLLEGVADQYHLALVGPTLAKLDNQLNALVTALNSFSATERLGDELSIGTLDFQSAPVVDYFAPTLSYGLTEKISIGLGIPIIRFFNEMRILSGGVSNAEAICAQTCNTSADLRNGFDQLIALSRDIPGALQ